MNAELLSLSTTLAADLASLRREGRVQNVWLEGMVARGASGRTLRIDWSDGPVLSRDDGPWIHDLSDPVTCAALLLLAREVWGEAHGTGRVHVRPTVTGWVATSCGQPIAEERLTEVAALCAAIHAAAKVSP